MEYIYIGLTLLLTVYGQLVLKWQIGLSPGATLAGTSGLALLRFVASPWVMSAFAAAFVAALCWITVLSRMALSKAYPFTALSFPLVALGAAACFGEDFDLPKVAGTALVIAGVLVLARSGA